MRMPLLNRIHAWFRAPLRRPCRMCGKLLADTAMVRDVRGSFCSQSCADAYWWSCQHHEPESSSRSRGAQVQIS